MSEKILIPIFADQLSEKLTALNGVKEKDAVILMMEVRNEADTVWHHRKKLIFLFSAMRHFAAKLEEGGWTVDYVKLTDKDNQGDFTAEVKRALKRHDIDRIRVTEPSEYRVLELVKSWEDELGLDVTVLPDDRFLASKEDFAEWAEGRKALRMEYFYREMRRRYELLMDGDDPEGGQWNYDQENRKPPKSGLDAPARKRFKPDEITQDVIDMVGEQFSDRFGQIEGFEWGVTRKDAKAALKHFIDRILPTFGDYQDAMVTDEPFLFHSLISMYINAGLLDPLKVCQEAEEAYKDGHAPINAVEGFIRQILGWREYVRGIYWLKMPDYLEENALSATRDLPEFYWTGKTDMHCMSQAIGQTIEYGYAHHIQRLMITGNFALLAGIDPKQVHEWYLAVYLDAFEWVELPNTLGMSQFGDGGVLASKPYASSGAYINRMSTYCSDCKYNVRNKTEDDACPFNSLYWDFLARNEDVLKGNPRLNMPYRNWEKKEKGDKIAHRNRARWVLDNIESL